MAWVPAHCLREQLREFLVSTTSSCRQKKAHRDLVPTRGEASKSQTVTSVLHTSQASILSFSTAPWHLDYFYPPLLQVSLSQPLQNNLAALHSSPPGVPETQHTAQTAWLGLSVTYRLHTIVSVPGHACHCTGSIPLLLRPRPQLGSQPYIHPLSTGLLALLYVIFTSTMHIHKQAL